MNADRISLIRTVCLGLTGVSCVAYSVLALASGVPNPVGWYWPGALGLASGLVITIAAFMGGKSEARAATDELYKAVSHRAERQAYWVSMALFVIVAVSCAWGLMPWDTGFAVFGTLMGASFLLLFVYHDLRMR